MRVLVTGGAGFIGSNVVDAFVQAGHEVGVVDDLSTGVRDNVNSKAKFWHVDIRSEDLGKVIRDFRPEVISHHAAQISVGLSARDPKLDAQVNVLGGLNVLDAALKAGVRRVLFSSTGGAMYGESAPIPSPETTLPTPVSPYGVAKLAFERYLHAFNFMHGLEWISLRYANVYGPRQNPHGEAGVVAIFCQAILDGRPLTVNGDGLQTRDYVYVGDVVRANLKALDMRQAGGGRGEAGGKDSEQRGAGSRQVEQSAVGSRQSAARTSGPAAEQQAVGSGQAGRKGEGGRREGGGDCEEAVRRGTAKENCDGELKQQATGTIFNIGTGREASVLDLVRLLEEGAGRKLEVRHAPPRPGEQRRSCLDPTLARQELGWEPTVDLSRGLRETFGWFADRKANDGRREAGGGRR